MKGSLHRYTHNSGVLPASPTFFAAGGFSQKGFHFFPWELVGSVVFCGGKKGVEQKVGPSLLGESQVGLLVSRKKKRRTGVCVCVCVCGVAEYPVTTISSRGAVVPTAVAA